MRLTWKDAVATVFTAGIVAIYIAFLLDLGWPLIASVRGTTAALLVLGAVGGCALGTVGAQYGKNLQPVARTLVVIATVLGVVALGAGIYALITASEVALAVLFGAIVALWLTATVRHAFTKPATPMESGRDVHEVIDPYRVAPK
jgi:hypothetical protein